MYHAEHKSKWKTSEDLMILDWILTSLGNCTNYLFSQGKEEPFCSRKEMSTLKFSV
jgi:hypothetical protein